MLWVLSSIINYKFLKGKNHRVSPCVPKATTQQSALTNNQRILRHLLLPLYFTQFRSRWVKTHLIFAETKIKTLHHVWACKLNCSASKSFTLPCHLNTFPNYESSHQTCTRDRYEEKSHWGSQNSEGLVKVQQQQPDNTAVTRKMCAL